VESYPGWGGYGSAKAALDRLTAVLAIECPQLRTYSFDPGLASGRYRATDLTAGLAR
jgi:NAD(P)-dependent dehydrogenase (short-subunit alcohol dehydrogenase family)